MSDCYGTMMQNECNKLDLLQVWHSGVWCRKLYTMESLSKLQMFIEQYI